MIDKNNKKEKVIDLIKLILYHIFLFVIIPLVWIALQLSLCIKPYYIYNNISGIEFHSSLAFLLLNIFVIPYYFNHVSFLAAIARDEYKDKYLYNDNIIGYHDYISRADALNMVKEYKKDINNYTDDLYTPYDKCIEAIINTPAIKNNINDGKNKVYIDKEEVKDIINKNWFFNIISRRCAEELLNEIDRLEYHTLDQLIWHDCAIDGNPKENCGCLVKIIDKSDEKILHGYMIAEYDIDFKRWFTYGSLDNWEIVAWSPLPKNE